MPRCCCGLHAQASVVFHPRIVSELSAGLNSIWAMYAANWVPILGVSSPLPPHKHWTPSPKPQCFGFLGAFLLSFLLSFLFSLFFTSGPPANASGNSSHIATNLPLQILSGIFCGTGWVDNASTTGCSCLVPPRCVTTTDGIGFLFAATIDVLDSDPAPAPYSSVNEVTIKGWEGWYRHDGWGWGHSPYITAPGYHRSHTFTSFYSMTTTLWSLLLSPYTQTYMFSLATITDVTARHPPYFRHGPPLLDIHVCAHVPGH